LDVPVSLPLQILSLPLVSSLEFALGTEFSLLSIDLFQQDRIAPIFHQVAWMCSLFLSLWATDTITFETSILLLGWQFSSPSAVSK
jgi:hypothetical protein